MNRWLIAVLILLAIWTFAAASTSSNTVTFPSPWDTVLAISRQPTLFSEAVFNTLVRVLAGSIVGVSIAYIVYYFGYLNSSFLKITSAAIEFVRPIPPIALTPFFIIWLGLGDLSQISMVAMGAFMVAFVSLIEAVDNLDPGMMKASALSRRSLSDECLRLVFPATLPSMTGPYRIVLGTAFGLTVAAEFLGAQGGLGYIIRNARTVLQLDVVLASAVILGVLAALLDFALRITINYLTPWAE